MRTLKMLEKEKCAKCTNKPSLLAILSTFILFPIVQQLRTVGKESKATPKSLCPKPGLLQTGKLVDCKVCVKSRYDGRGLECAKMGKWRKGRQGKGENVIKDKREDGGRRRADGERGLGCRTDRSGWHGNRTGRCEVSAGRTKEMKKWHKSSVRLKEYGKTLHACMHASATNEMLMQFEKELDEDK